MFYNVQKMVNEGSRLYYLMELRKNQWKNVNELRSIQLKRLKHMIRYAYDYIPYYHRLFDTVRFKPDDLRDHKDLSRIPITTKLDVQRNYKDFLPKGIDTSRYTRHATSGSTGIPLEVIEGSKARKYSEALVQYAFFECGTKLRDKFVFIRTARAPRAVKQSRFRHVNMFRIRFNIVVAPILDPFIKTVESLRKINPDVICTSASTLEDLCANDTSGINPRLIFSHATTLTKHCRQLVRSKFDKEVFDTYGSIEFNRLGLECAEHSGLHMITDCAVVEYLDDDGKAVCPGEPGETVVTGLYNYTMPLIRYELGDIAIPIDDKCTCGRGWPLIKGLRGRKSDSFILPSGRVLSPALIWGWVYTQEIKWNIWCVSHFQLVQEARDRIVLKIVKGKKFDRKVIDRILSNIRNGVGEKVVVGSEVVDQIPKERSGKRRWIVSHLQALEKE